ncbi:MAG: Mur ligase family protein [Simkaniaceae bacterium]|nr:Mur ligase family protein [Simkaniaceae bacterium]
MFDYPGSLRALFNLSYFSAKKDLRRIEKVYRELGFTKPSFETIHIAGTNGKGSVAAKIAAGLQLEGKSVGLFTSPHISTFRERVRINGELISEKAFAGHLQKIIEGASTYPTHFEALTLIALLQFEAENVDVAVIETGVGGRQDSTNFITPKLSVITSISRDHTLNLGETLDEIAIEKGGIIKPGVPVILGAKAQRKPLIEIAKKKKAPMVFGIMSDGFFDDENIEVAALALKHLGVSDENICKGVVAKPRCRFEIIPNLVGKNLGFKNFPEYVVLDVAHNPDGLEHLFRAISLKLPSLPIRVVCAFGKGKEHAKCLEVIEKHATHIHPVSVRNEKIAPVEILEDLLGSRSERISSLEEAFCDGEILVFCGSFYLMEKVRQKLGFNDPVDPEDALGDFGKHLKF